MFTGIIEAVGRLKSIEKQGDFARVEVSVDLMDNDLETGDSVAVNGVCLTVTGRSGGTFWADLGAATLNVTTLGRLNSGDPVNFERALKLGARLGGHLVQGHVDGVGRIVEMKEVMGGIDVAIEAEAKLLKYIVWKGSVAVNGVSLTVSACEDNIFHVFLIPHTIEITAFKFAAKGHAVNLEVDMIGKYIEKLTRTEHDTENERPPIITEEFLKLHGF
jgi:riboflavin synthase